MNVFSQPAMQIQQGSRFSVALVLRRGDGTFVDLTGRSFVFRIYGRAETHDLEATIVDSNKAVALVGEGLTADLPTNRALQYSWMMRIGDSGAAFSPALVQGAVAVYDVGGGLSGQATIPDGGEIVFGVEVDGASVVSVTSNGLPGLSPWEVEGQTYAEWLAGNVSDPIEQVKAEAALVFAKAVRTDTPTQGLTDAQRANARDNILATARDAGMRSLSEFKVGGVSDFNALNDALRAMSNGGPGRGLVLPELYEINEPISLTGYPLDGVTLQGAPGFSGIVGDSGTYSLLRLDDLSRVKFDGLTLRHDRIDPAEDNGSGMMYSYANVVNVEITRCTLSCEKIFTNAFSFYARINSGPEGNKRIDGLWIHHNKFINIGRMAILTMNRPRVGTLNPRQNARRVLVSDNYAEHIGSAAPGYAATGGNHGMFLSADGYYEMLSVLRNYIKRPQGIVLEFPGNNGNLNPDRVAQANVQILHNIVEDMSRGVNFISIDDNAGKSEFRAFDVGWNRPVGDDYSGAYQSNLQGLAGDSVVHDNIFPGREAFAAAAITRTSGFVSERNKYVNRYDPASGGANAVVVDAGYFMSRSDTFDTSGTTKNFAPIQLGAPGAVASGSVISDATILKGAGGFDISTHASSDGKNVVLPYKNAAGVRIGGYRIISMPDADFTLTGNDATLAYQALRLDGALTTTRKLTFPSPAFLAERKAPLRLRNNAGASVILKVAGGIDGDSVAPGAIVTVIYDAASAIPRAI